jgi:acyl-CoA synthetase (AMP-forming)/AMP-acid ligase II
MNVFDYLFEQSSALEKDFVLGTHQHITFRELHETCSRLAVKLRTLVGENQHIIILSENSIFQIIAYLSIFKSGNICIPLNPAIESENLDQILAKTNVNFVFVSKRYRGKHENYAFTVLDEDFIRLTDADIGLNDSAPTTEFDDQRLAEIIFTSGSTGEQKGVLISHKNIIANTRSIVEYLELTSVDTMMVVLPFYYCYGLSLLHTHLKVGGSIVLNNNFIFIGSVLNDINKYNCTGFAGVPSHYQILLRKTRDFKTTSFPSLRYVTQAGGKLHVTFITEFVESFPAIKFYVMYGQTEATARLSYLPPEMLSIKTGSIGKGIPGVTLHVVDANGELVKPGETGEIIAKGDNIMQGYLNEEEETARTIIDGWLYTGDLARVDEDGYIFIQSRKKEIIKVGGVRISPQEIEEAIVTYPGVIGCTIEAIPDELLGEAVKAIVFINEDDKLVFSEDVIKKHCASVLSMNKIPKVVVFETKLPYNASGKKVKSS